MLSALLLGGALAAFFASAAAQDAGGLSLLRGTASLDAPAGASSGNTAGARLRNSVTDQLARERRTGVAKRVRARRSRSPTAVPVRANTQQPIVSPNLVRDVQPTLTGVPDPTTPLALPRRRLREDDPYSQVGYGVGSLNLYPAIQESIGYDSNPNRVSPPAKGSFVSRTEADLRLQSDWSNHELNGFLRGAYNVYPDVKGADRPEGEGALRLRLDASRDTKFDVEGRYVLDTQRPGSPELNAPVTARPLVSSFGASVGATQTFNRLRLELRGGVDRTIYEDAQLPSGVILRQSDRNVTQYGVKLRAGYEVSPGIKPFVDVLADRGSTTRGSAAVRTDSASRPAPPSRSPAR
jgi:hypothetical protein